MTPTQPVLQNVRDLPATPIAAKLFAPFGTLIEPADDAGAFGAADAKLDLSAGTPRFYVMRLGAREMTVRRITRHRRVTQVLASAGGRPWFLVVAPPPDEDAAAAAVPWLDAIRAFRIPGDAAVMLARSTWHAGPLFEEAEASFFNLELSDTNVADHQDCDLVQRFGVAFRVITAGGLP